MGWSLFAEIQTWWVELQYCVKFDRYVEKLEIATKRLRAKLIVVGKLNKASTGARWDEIELWMKQSETILEKAEKSVKELKQEEQKICCLEFVGKPICRYKKANDAETLTKDVLEMIKNYEDIDKSEMPEQPLQWGSMVAPGYIETGSSKEFIENLRRVLVDEKKLAVGVYGEEGAGKTMLVEKLVQKVEESGDFKKIVIIRHGGKVNSENGLLEIQKSIAETIGFTLSQTATVDHIRKQVRDKINANGDKILFIVDHLEEKINLNLICLEWPESEGSNCRIVVVSRDEQVCKNMGSDLNFEVKRLSSDESWDFFTTSATDYLKQLEGFKEIEDPKTRISKRTWSPGQIKQYVDAITKLINDSNRESTNQSLVIPPVACKIDHIDREKNYKWSPSMEAVLIKESYLKIKGAARTKWLFPNAKYGAYFLYKLTDHGNNYGFDKKKVTFSIEISGKEISTVDCYLEPAAATKSEQRTPITTSDDGYMDILMGSFDVKEGSDKSIYLFVKEYTDDLRKCGLVFGRFELRLLRN